MIVGGFDWCILWKIKEEIQHCKNTNVQSSNRHIWLHATQQSIEEALQRVVGLEDQ